MDVCIGSWTHRKESLAQRKDVGWREHLTWSPEGTSWCLDLVSSPFRWVHTTCSGYSEVPSGRTCSSAGSPSRGGGPLRSWSWVMGCSVTEIPCFQL